MFPVVVTVAALGVGCVLYGIFIERFRYRVIRHRLDILPATAQPLVVLHLSDLHFVRHDPRKTRFLAGLPKADVTVVTGDLLGEPEAIDTTVESVRAVRGRIASWFVLGSNDYFVPRPLNYLAYFRPGRQRRRAAPGRAPDLIRVLATDGWEDLTDSRRTISLLGLETELLGLDDAHIGRHDLRVAPRSEDDRFGLAVMHSPDTAPRRLRSGTGRSSPGTPTAARSGSPDRCAGDELLDAAGVRVGVGPDGVIGAPHVPGSRNEQVRAVPLLVPAGGHVSRPPSRSVGTR